MKKIYVSIMLGILLIIFITLVTAGVVVLTNLTPVVFNKPTEKEAPTLEQITFDCGTEKGMVIDGFEPDGRWDENDLQSAIGRNCSEEVSNIYMNNLKYQQL